MFCLDKWARNNLTAHIYGSSLTRHDDFRELVFDVMPCKPDPTNGVCLKTNSTQIASLVSQLEAVVMVDTQSYMPFQNQNMSVAMHSHIRSFPLSSSNKFEQSFRVQRGRV
jgi:hypothetical protein